jgi:hypothetical protein
MQTELLYFIVILNTNGDVSDKDFWKLGLSSGFVSFLLFLTAFPWQMITDPCFMLVLKYFSASRCFMNLLVCGD